MILAARYVHRCFGHHGMQSEWASTGPTDLAAVVSLLSLSSSKLLPGSAHHPSPFSLVCGRHPDSPPPPPHHQFHIIHTQYLLFCNALRFFFVSSRLCLYSCTLFGRQQRNECLEANDYGSPTTLRSSISTNSHHPVPQKTPSSHMPLHVLCQA